MPTFTCPHCSSAYTFDGEGVAVCPSCGCESKIPAAAKDWKVPAWIAPVSTVAAVLLLASLAAWGVNAAGFKTSDALGVVALVACVVAAVVFVATWLFLPWLLLGRLREIRDELRELNGKTGKL